jgi:hypothetical protein
MDEAWKAVADNDRYEVSSLGRVRRVAAAKGAKVGRILRQQANARGYATVVIGFGVKGSGKTREIHRMVALAFLGPCPAGMEVNHKNSVKADPRLENLEYVTRSQNQIHSYASGLRMRPDVRGERNPRASLTEANVGSIRARVLAGEAQASLAREFGVARQTVGALVSGRTWTELARAGSS